MTNWLSIGFILHTGGGVQVQAELTRLPDNHSWRCPDRRFSAESPRTGPLTWATRSQWPSEEAFLGPPYLGTKSQLDRHVYPSRGTADASNPRGPFALFPHFILRRPRRWIFLQLYLLQHQFVVSQVDGQKENVNSSLVFGQNILLKKPSKGPCWNDPVITSCHNSRQNTKCIKQYLCTSFWLHWLGLVGQRWDTWAQHLNGTAEWNKQGGDQSSNVFGLFQIRHLCTRAHTHTILHLLPNSVSYGFPSSGSWMNCLENMLLP